MLKSICYMVLWGISDAVTGSLCFCHQKRIRQIWCCGTVKGAIQKVSDNHHAYLNVGIIALKIIVPRKRNIYKMARIFC